jgi:hypothetical protein
MSLLERLRRLPAEQRALLVQSTLWVACMSVAVQVMTTERLRRAAARLAKSHRAGSPSRPSAQRVGWAVAAAGRRIPGARCLPRALAAQIILGRLGYEPTVHYGVRHDPPGSLRAHAWVSCDGEIVVGGEEASRFQTLKGSNHPT